MCDPGTLSYGTDYYWYVVATDNHSATTTGPTWDFTTMEGFHVYLPLVMKDYTPGGGWLNIKTEDFEGTFPNDWVLSDSGSNPGEYLWGKRGSPCPVYAGDYSGWAIGAGTDGSGLSCGNNYPNNVYSWMIYGPFSLEAAIDAKVDFAFWLNSQEDHDYLLVSASIDGLSFYGTGYWGEFSSWFTDVFDLTSVFTLGDLTDEPQVWIAFSFYSDSSYNVEGGALIDDIVVRKCDFNCATSKSNGNYDGEKVNNLMFHFEP
jgi:hypothetical protein